VAVQWCWCALTHDVKSLSTLLIQRNSFRHFQRARPYARLLSLTSSLASAYLSRSYAQPRWGRAAPFRFIIARMLASIRRIALAVLVIENDPKRRCCANRGDELRRRHRARRASFSLVRVTKRQIPRIVRHAQRPPVHTVRVLHRANVRRPFRAKGLQCAAEGEERREREREKRREEYGEGGDSESASVSMRATRGGENIHEWDAVCPERCVRTFSKAGP
jgi:hypothetical protein